MIRIERHKCPEALKDGKKYNNKSVVNELWDMQNEKCCYCERKIPIKGHDKAVEHFEPKSIFKKKENDWENLLLACAQCNGKKSDKFPVLLTNNEHEPKVVYIKKRVFGKHLLIDPSIKDPEIHIGFIINDEDESWGSIISKDDIGRFTIEVIGLDTLFYTRRNIEHLIKLRRTYTLLLEAMNSSDEDTISLQKSSFELYMSARREHAALTREFVKQKKLNVRFGIKILKEFEAA